MKTTTKRSLLFYLAFVFSSGQSLFGADADKVQLILSADDKVVLHTFAFRVFYTMIAADSPFNGQNGGATERLRSINLAIKDLDQVSPAASGVIAKNEGLDLANFCRQLLQASVAENAEDTETIYRKLGFSNNKVDPIEVAKVLSSRWTRFVELVQAPQWLNPGITHSGGSVP